MDQKFTIYKYRWVVLAWYMYVSALTQLYWLNFAAIETYIEDMLHIPPGDVMWFTLVFPLVQVILTLPAGIIIDKKGYKYGIGLGVVFTGVFALLRVVNPGSFIILLISQVGISIGQPFVLNGITKLATAWFPPKEEATAVGLGSLALFIGMMVALGATPWLVEGLGFAPMLWIYGIAGAIGVVGFLIFVKGQPPSPSRPAEVVEQVSGWGAIRNILKYRDFVILGFIALVGIGVFNGLATWLEKILNELHNIPMTDAGNISAVLIFSGMVGCFVIPLISDKIGRRKPFLILASLVGALAVTAFIFAKSYELNMLNGILIGLFLISALPIMLTMSAEITGQQYAGISVGYLQLLGNAAAVVLVALMEFLRGSTGGFVLPLAILAVLLSASFIVSLFIHDTRPQGQDTVEEAG